MRTSNTACLSFAVLLLFFFCCYCCHAMFDRSPHFSLRCSSQPSFKWIRMSVHLGRRTNSNSPDGAFDPVLLVISTTSGSNQLLTPFPLWDREGEGGPSFNRAPDPFGFTVLGNARIENQSSNANQTKPNRISTTGCQD